MLDWDDLAAMAGDDIEYGSHAHSHRELDTVPLRAAVDDIARSKAALEAHLGCPVTALAYPYGYSSPALRREVEALGFTTACGVKHALSSDEDDRFSLARVIVDADTDIDVFQSLLRGEGLRIAPPTSTLRRWGWRSYRRLRAALRRSRADIPA